MSNVRTKWIELVPENATDRDIEALIGALDDCKVVIYDPSNAGFCGRIRSRKQLRYKLLSWFVEQLGGLKLVARESEMEEIEQEASIKTDLVLKRVAWAHSRRVK